MREILRLLARSWHDIGYAYPGLTSNEREVISQDTFTELLRWMMDEGIASTEDMLRAQLSARTGGACGCTACMERVS
jgi:hypothetical protein